MIRITLILYAIAEAMAIMVLPPSAKLTFKKRLFFVTALFALSGCGTVVTLVDPSNKYTAYAGVAYDFDMAKQWGLPILDLPLSFLLDTVLLPYALSQ